MAYLELQLGVNWRQGLRRMAGKGSTVSAGDAGAAVRREIALLDELRSFVAGERVRKANFVYGSSKAASETWSLWPVINFARAAIIRAA